MGYSISLSDRIILIKLYGFYAYTNLTGTWQMKSKGYKGNGGAARIFSGQVLDDVIWWVFIKGGLDGLGVRFNR